MIDRRSNLGSTALAESFHALFCAIGLDGGYLKCIVQAVKIEALNSEWFCISLDNNALALKLESGISHAGVSALIWQRCGYLLRASRARACAPKERLAQMVHAIESVVPLPTCRDEVLAAARCCASSEGALAHRQTGSKSR